MARIENVNIDGTDYDVGKIATTSSLGVVQVGEGLSITQAGVLSASGDNTMLVTITEDQTTGSETWTSNYTFAQLAANPMNIRFSTPDHWFCDIQDFSSIVPDSATYYPNNGDYIHWQVIRNSVLYEVYIGPSYEESGQTVTNPAHVGSTRLNNNQVKLVTLPRLSLADYATSIPDNTTITLDIGQQTSLTDNNNVDCEPIGTVYQGSFIVLPVRRRVASGASGYVTEKCLITETSDRESSSVAASYYYRSFWFNGEKYKMTYTSSSGSSYVWTITKVPVGTTYTAGTGINISNGVISCTLADANSVSY